MTSLEDRLQTDRLLEIAPIASVTISTDGRVEWCNLAARRLLTRDDGDLHGRHFADLVVSDPHVLQRWLDTAHADVGSDRLRSRLRTSTGRSSVIELAAAPLDDDLTLVQIVEVSARPASAAAQRSFRTALVELSEMSHDHHDDDDFLGVFIRRAIEVVPGAEGGTILLRDPGSDTFRFVAGEGFDMDVLAEATLELGDLLGDPDDPRAVIHHEIDDSHVAGESAERLARAGRLDELRCSVSAPVVLGGEPLAFLNLNSFSDRDAFDSTSVEMTTVLGRLIADLIRRRRLEAELRDERESFRRLAHHDPLTGLANRRRVEIVLAD
ncbi:MAG: GAF domain-containing protein, partial [Actinomycetota bacterium]